MDCWIAWMLVSVFAGTHEARLVHLIRPLPTTTNTNHLLNVELIMIAWQVSIDLAIRTHLVQKSIW